MTLKEGRKKEKFEKPFMWLVKKLLVDESIVVWRVE